MNNDGGPALDADDIEEITAMGMVIVAKVLDELEPNSDKITTSKLALASFACAYAAKHFEHSCLSAREEKPHE